MYNYGSSEVVVMFSPASFAVYLTLQRCKHLLNKITKISPHFPKLSLNKNYARFIAHCV